MTVVWQSAIPPTLCTIFLCVLYVQFATARPVCSMGSRQCANVLITRFLYQKKPDFWYSTIQGLIGKLYVLSLFYMMYGAICPCLAAWPLMMLNTVLTMVPRASSAHHSSQRLRFQTNPMIRTRLTTDIMVRELH